MSSSTIHASFHAEREREGEKGEEEEEAGGGEEKEDI